VVLFPKIDLFPLLPKIPLVFGSSLSGFFSSFYYFLGSYFLLKSEVPALFSNKEVELFPNSEFLFYVAKTELGLVYYFFCSDALTSSVVLDAYTGF